MKYAKKGISSALVAAAVVVVIVIIAAAAVVLYFPVTTTLTSTSTVSSTATTTLISTVTTSKTTTPGHAFSLALLVGGDETDAGWNAVAIDTANLIHELYGWNVSISRDVPYSDQARVMTSYAQSGYNVVWAHGGQFISDTYTVAKNFNNTFFMQSSGPANVTPPSNVVTLGPSFQVTGYYQAGVLAAKMTKTNAVAVVIGQWYDYLSMEFYAFQAGAQSANPNVKVYARVAGTWGDASLGFQIAQTLIQTQHVDVIAQIADTTGRGVISAAQQYNASIIGTVGDQAVLAPYNTMTSVMMNITAFASMVVQHVMNGTFKQDLGGRVISMNLGYLGPFHNYDSQIPQSVKDLLAATVRGIQNGTIVVPQKVTANPPPDPS